MLQLMSRVPDQPPNAQNPVNDALFRAAFRNSPAMHSIVRFADAMLVEVNETFTRNLGYSREEVIGKTPFICPGALICQKPRMSSNQACALGDKRLVG